MSVQGKGGRTRFDTMACLRKAPGLPELLHRGGELIRDDEDWIRNLGDELACLIPCLTDAFSRLRYTHYLVQRLIRAGGLASLPSLPPSAFTHPLSSLLFRALDFQCRLTETQGSGGNTHSPSASPEGVEDLLGVSRLMGLIDGQKTVEAGDLVDMLGLSPFSDALVVVALRHSIRQTARRPFARALRTHLLQPAASSAKRRLLLDIAGEHRLRILTNEEIQRLWDEWSEDRNLFPALLRYIGECRLRSLATLLEGRLAEWESVDPPSLLLLIDVLGQLEVGSAKQALHRFLEKVGPGTALGNLAQDLTRRVLAAHYQVGRGEIGGPEGGGENLIPEGRTAAGLGGKQALAQFVFHGDPSIPGGAGESGVATLVRTLGDALAARGGWRGIYTFGLLSGSRIRKPSPAEECLSLVKPSVPGHWTISIPITFDLQYPSLSFLVHEHELARSIRRSLEIHRLDPDIFHIRYSDNASYAACRVAVERGGKVVFTLTPDPHREIAIDEKKLRPMDRGEALTILNKIGLADRLVQAADGYVLIGHVWQEDRIFPYFPHLWLSKRINKRLLRFIPEGIEMDIPFEKDRSGEELLRLLFAAGAPSVLSPANRNRPLLLNVGRLNPIKGQANLVRAWAFSSLRDIYNLVLIGGNPASRSPGERLVREEIERVVSGVPEVQGRFCHLNALPNRTIRLLEQSIVAGLPAPLPHVYLCSSLKEEFGMAILEAMSAGFLALGPLRGGVGNYIDSGENGFLIDTSDADRLRDGMESILLEAGDPAPLSAVAQRGRQGVRSLFDIRRIAGIFDDFYAGLTETSLERSQS